MNSPLHFSAVPRSAPTLENMSRRPSLLKSPVRQSCRSRMVLKKLTSAALNVPSWLLIHRLAGCQWWEMNRSGQPSPVRSPTVALKDQSGWLLMPAAAAWSVIVTWMGVCAGGVGCGGLGVGPTPGAAGSGGSEVGVRVVSETGPLGQLACSMSALGPARPTMASADPFGLAASPMTSSLAAWESAETAVTHLVPLKCTTSVRWPC